MLPTTPQPWTTTVRAIGAADGLAKLKFTSSAEVPVPLLPTNVEPWKTHMSRSLPALTSASNSEYLAYVVPAGIVTGISCAFGESSEQVLSVGSSATVPGDTAAGTSPRAVAVNGPE